ncbi:microtubule-associated protein 1B [Echeneis naucrates]|uniref:Microtubule-associated protein 1B-like n=1 Tax=Echeneis naucrates TaxID=173247 RepID=A0A665TTX8_ECHNA|nr:microtubule-associated protein 1B-like [Echeneis naucrates]
MMAALERGGGPGSCPGSCPGPSQPAADYSVLVVVGALHPAGLLERLLRQIESGVRCWPVDLHVSVLDQQLKLFVSRHSAFVSEEVPGQRTLQHSGNVLDTQVVVNPAHDFVCSEVRRLICDSSRHKLLVLAGRCMEETGDIILQKGCFSLNDLIRIFSDEEVEELLGSADSEVKAKLTLSCPNYGLWKDFGLLEKHNFQSLINIQVNPPPILPEMEGLQEFTEYLSESLEPESPFDLLEPPSTVGFLKLSRPCCYIFPGGKGDSAFFAVNGFNVLVNGGSDPRSCFWKLVRHLDRIDSVLLTHIGVDNLPGLNSLLWRKAAEQEDESAGSQTEEDWVKKLISPELGVVFFNVPDKLHLVQEDPSELRSCDQVALTLQHLQKLSIKPELLCRLNGTVIEPIILFQKMGVGRLELYTLNPVNGSREFEALMRNWPNSGSIVTGSNLPLACLVSICALLVWHPSSPQEKIIRVLFPGCTPQNKILDGLEKLKHLDFLKHPSVCLENLETSKTEKPPKRAESRESLKSHSKDIKASSAFQKDKPGRGDVKKQEVKTKPKSAGDNAPKDKKDGEEKSKLKDGDVKTKPRKPAEKTAPKKDVSKEEKKEVKKKEEKALAAAVKTEESTEKKKELGKKETVSLKSKKDKPEPKKDIKRDVKTDEKKTTKPPVKEVKKTTNGASSVASVGSTELKKSLGKSGTLKKDGTLQKKDATNRGTKGKTSLKNQENQGEADRSVSTPEDMASETQRLSLEGDQKNTAIMSFGGAKVNGNQALTVESPEMFRSVEKNQEMAIASSPLAKTPKSDLSVNFDLTPTAFQPGCLKHGPEDACVSSEEKTLELVSPADSAPNSAGHTPFHQSPEEDMRCLGEDSSLGARGSSLGFEDYNQGGSCRTSDLGSLREGLENSISSQDKQSSLLALSPLKDLMADSSPTMTSMPAEVGSPHSTEVDESLSVSLEQLVPPAVISPKGATEDRIYTNGHVGDTGSTMAMALPLRSSRNGCCGNGSEEHIHVMSELTSDVLHDVDLCLVSPCEFQHPRTPENHQQHVSPGLSAGISPDFSDNNNQPQDQSSSECPSAYSQETPPTSVSDSLQMATDSDVPPATDDCPSITEELESDDDSSHLFLPTHPQDHPSLQFSHRAGQLSSHDPPPAPIKDLPPLPPQPGACMADAEADGSIKNLKSSAAKTKKPSSTVQKGTSGSSTALNGKSKANSSTGSVKMTSSLDMRSSSRNSLGGSRTGTAKLPSSAAKAAVSEGAVVYVDLAYLPSGCASSTVDQDFFRHLRSSYYIVSGDDPVKEASMRSTLDSLLEGKSSWSDVQVTLIPTFDSLAMHQWYQETHDRQKELSITVLGSNSTVAMQDETFPACKVEF